MLGRRRGGGDLGLLFLFIEIARVGIDHIPPVTLATLAINIVIHLFSPFDLNFTDACIGSSYVLYHSQIQRLLISAFYHLHDYHLYYNMTSLLWKGRKLEPILGSWIFGCMIVLFAIGSSILMVASSCPFYVCAAGFSAVLFGLKVVVNQLDPNAHGYIMGIPIEIRYLAWAELALIHVLVPNSSFLGHICGIIMGYAYIYGFLNPIFSVLEAIRDFVQRLNQPAIHTQHTSYSYANTTGHRDTNQNNQNQNYTQNNQNNNNQNGQQSGYSNLGQGFYNRYQNYDYNNPTSPGTQRNTNSPNTGPTATSVLRNRNVVNGWLER